LLDDTELIVEAARTVGKHFGVVDLDLERWRAIARRPIRATYDILAGRPVTDTEWTGIQRDWATHYEAGLPAVRLAPDALGALRAVAANGWTQSLVSMTPQDYLIRHVAAFGLGGYLTRISGVAPGLGQGAGPSKAAILGPHLASLGHAGRNVTVIGDNPDDAVAATSVGARAILVPTGDANAKRLAATGQPVASTLTAALTLARSAAGTARGQAGGRR
jgi:phosphoglycolate phosphatase-like HAD superfamily hydrolase